MSDCEHSSFEQDVALGNGDCNICLKAELAEARRALVLISTALDAYGVRWCRDVAKDALQEKGE